MNMTPSPERKTEPDTARNKDDEDALIGQTMERPKSHRKHSQVLELEGFKLNQKAVVKNTLDVEADQE